MSNVKRGLQTSDRHLEVKNGSVDVTVYDLYEGEAVWIIWGHQHCHRNGIIWEVADTFEQVKEYLGKFIKKEDVDTNEPNLVLLDKDDGKWRDQADYLIIEKVPLYTGSKT